MERGSDNIGKLLMLEVSDKEDSLLDKILGIISKERTEGFNLYKYHNKKARKGVGSLSRRVIAIAL